MMFDTHAHLLHPQFDADRAEILEDLKNHGIGYVMNVGCCPDTSRRCVEMAENYPFMYASVGTHPDDAGDFQESDLDIYRELAKNPKVKAIGEIGLDYYYDDNPPEVQKKAFIAQMALAEELDMPVILHDRDAHGDVLDIVRQFPRVKGVFHCYSGSPEMAKEVVKLGWFVGFTGVVTFKNARKSVETARTVPLENIVVETDCPYMAPEPHRGKRNDSRYIPFMVQKVAEIRGITVKEAEIATTNNAKRLFRIP